MIWASLIGIAVSVIALGLRTNKIQNILQPVQDLMLNFDKPFGNKSISVLAEFANELTPTNITDKNE